MSLKKLADDVTAASASGDNGIDATFVASSITVLLEKFDEEKSVVDRNVSVAEQLASLLATVSAPGAAQVSAPDASIA